MVVVKNVLKSKPVISGGIPAAIFAGLMTIATCGPALAEVPYVEPNFSREIFARTRVGNTYVNRNMVGAVVGVQPFGGQGLSGTGPKAGGPNYLQRFAVERTFTDNITAKGGNPELLALDD